MNTRNYSFVNYSSFLIVVILLQCLHISLQAQRLDERVFTVVPLTFLNSEHHKVQWSLRPNDLASRLLVDGMEYSMRPATVPLKVFESANTMLIFTRKLFSDVLGLAVLDIEGTNGILSVPFPSKYKGHVFRNATLLSNHLYAVTFDPVDDAHWLNRWRLDSIQPPSFDERFQLLLSTPQGAFHFDFNLIIKTDADTLWIGNRNLIAAVSVYGSQPSAEYYVFPTNHRLVELATSRTNVVAIFRSDGYRKRNSLAAPIACWDVKRQSRIHWMEQLPVPSKVRLHGDRISAEWVRSPKDLVDLIFHELRNSGNSGTFYIGSGNAQGRVAWAQAAYLNGMIDLLVYSGHFRLGDFLPSELKNAVRTRIEIELFLLNQLLSSTNSGLTSYRYTIDRKTPALFASHSGLVLRMLNRYYSSLPKPTLFSNFPAFAIATSSLVKHIEDLHFTSLADDWAPEEGAFLVWPRGAPVKFDGVPIPYNQQNIWAEAVLTSPYLAINSKKPARQVVLLFLSSELNPPQATNFIWPYWYGPARLGWSAPDGVSMNSPSFSGHAGNANILYRSLDASAVLSLAAHKPEMVSANVIEYLAASLSAGALNLSLYERFFNLSVSPSVPPHVIARDARLDGERGFANFVWSLLLLSETDIGQVDQDMDGMPDCEELFAMTDSGDSTSHLQLRPGGVEDSKLVIRWFGRAGVTYSVQHATHAEGPWITEQYISPTGDGELLWAAADTTLNQLFIRLSVVARVIGD